MEFSRKDTQMVKGIAIILMFFHHNFFRQSRFEDYVINSWPFDDVLICNIAKFSKICVALFVFLSAYGMTLSYKRISSDYIVSVKDVYKSTVKRYLSIMFGYWFVFVGTQFAAIFFEPTRWEKIYGTGTDGVIRFVLDFFGVAEMLGMSSFVRTWWYIGMAVMLVLLMPLLLRMYTRIGVLLLPISCFLPRFLKLDMDSEVLRYLLTIAIGIWCADSNILVKIKKFKFSSNRKVSAVVKMTAELACLYLLYEFRKSGAGKEYLEVADAFAAFIVILFSFEFLTGMGGLIRKPLEYLGKYSMDMFLTHTIFRGIWFDEFIYGFQSVWLIMLVLIGVSLLTSILIERLKEWIRYDRLENNVIGRLQRKIEMEEKGLCKG